MISKFYGEINSQFLVFLDLSWGFVKFQRIFLWFRLFLGVPVIALVDHDYMISIKPILSI